MSYSASDLAEYVARFLKARGYSLVSEGDRLPLPGTRHEEWRWKHIASGRLGERHDNQDAALMDALGDLAAEHSRLRAEVESLRSEVARLQDEAGAEAEVPDEGARDAARP